MMCGLLTKSLYEVWLSTLLFGFSLLAVTALLTYILPQIQEGLSGVLDEIPFVRSILTALLGTELGDEITARTMQAFLWVHPVVLALVWAHEITLCTRMPAGEIDRGTIDVLLGLPVSRRAVYFCESIVWLVSGLLIIVMGLLGHRIAAPAMPEEMRPELSRRAGDGQPVLCLCGGRRDRLFSVGAERPAGPRDGHRFWHRLGVISSELCRPILAARTADRILGRHGVLSARPNSAERGFPHPRRSSPAVGGWLGMASGWRSGCSPKHMYGLTIAVSGLAALTPACPVNRPFDVQLMVCT